MKFDLVEGLIPSESAPVTLTKPPVHGRQQRVGAPEVMTLPLSAACWNSPHASVCPSGPGRRPQVLPGGSAGSEGRVQSPAGVAASSRMGRCRSAQELPEVTTSEPLWWSYVSMQPLELICEKAVATSNRPLGPGEALRRVMECVASGILLPGQRSRAIPFQLYLESTSKTTLQPKTWGINHFYCLFYHIKLICYIII